MRSYRARKKAEGSLFDAEALAGYPSDPAGAIAAWSAERLTVPPGHPLEGQPMKLPGYGISFLRDVFRPGIREGLLCVARKNAKSSVVAVWLLAHLVGPVRRFGWRCGVVSTSKVKAGELKRLSEGIAIASNLRGLQFRRSPAPGRIESAWGVVDILAADSNAGAAAGFDLAVVDELGLLKERDRDLIASMRSSVSARDGRFVSLSVYGSAPFVPEILERRGDPWARGALVPSVGKSTAR